MDEREISAELRELEQRFALLNSEERVKALKAAVRGPMRALLKDVRSRFVATGIPHARELSKLIHAHLFRKKAVGFSVNIYGRGKKGAKDRMRKKVNREGKEVNWRYAIKDQGYLLRFFESGTRQRYTRGGFMTGGAKNRGAMTGHHFMRDARAAYDLGSVRDRMGAAMSAFIDRTLSRRNGK